MPGPDGVLSAALDFDGSLVEHHVHPLRWRHGAKEFIVAAAVAGIRLVLFSCRCAVVGLQELPGDAEDFWRVGRVPAEVEKSWALREEMESFLRAEGVWGLLVPWTSPGKPLVDHFVDDLFERPDWIVLAGELGVRLVHGVQTGEPPPMGAPGPVVAPSVLQPGPEPAPAGGG